MDVVVFCEMPLWLFGGNFMEAGLKEKLERNIWITRKCRINASERLLKSAKFVEFLNVYYSIFVIKNFDYPEKPLKYKHIRRISD